jgi:lysophospholipase L1-like esterase
MRRIAFLAVLIPAFAWGQGVQYHPGPSMYNPQPGLQGPSSSARPVEYLFDATGKPWQIAGGFQLDGSGYPGYPWAGSNVKWLAADGTILTPSGAPKPNAPSGLFPGGFGLSDAAHVGVSFDTGEWLEGPTEGDPLEASEGFELCVIVSGPLTSGEKVLLQNGQFGVSGYLFERGGGAGPLTLYVMTSAGQKAAATANLFVAGTANVACAGVGSGKILAQLNDGAIAETALSGAVVPAPTKAPRIGNYSDGQYAWPTGMFELRVRQMTSTPASIAQSISEAMRCTTPGACWQDDTQTVSHVAFAADGAPVDSKGLAWTTQGTLTAAASAYRWPNGFVPGMAPAVSFSGTDGFAGSATATPSGVVWGCFDFKTGSIAAGDSYLFSKGGLEAGNQSIYAKRWGDYFYLGFYNAASTKAETAGIQLTPSVSNAGCYAFEPVGEGTSKLRLVLDSTTREKNDAVLLPRQNSEPWYVGRDGHASAGRWTGTLTSWVQKEGGAAPSTAELQSLVRARRGMTDTTGTRAVSVTGPATTIETPGGTAVTTPANTLAVGPHGAAIYGARTSRILKNQRDPAATSTGGMLAANWTKRGTASVAAGCVTAPDGSCTADEVSGLGAAGVNDVYQVATGFTANAAISSAVWIRRVSTSGTVRVINVADSSKGELRVDLAQMPDWWIRISTDQSIPGVTVTTAFFATAGGAAGFQFGSVAGSLSFRVWRPWQVEGAVPGPDAYVNGSALAVAGTAAYSDQPDVSDAEGCVYAEVYPPASFAGGQAPRILGTDGAGGRAPIAMTGYAIAGFWDGATATTQVFDFGGRWRVLAWWSGANKGVRNVDTGAESVGTYSGTIWGANKRLWLGSGGGTGDFLNGRIRIVKVGATKDACDTEPTRTTIACLGDSLSALYPTNLQDQLGVRYVVTNAGVGGNTAAQMLARWRSDLRGRGHQKLVLLGGINDLVGDATAAATFATLNTIVNEARLDGSSVIWMTVTPFKGSVLWTAGRQTQADALNTMIRAQTGARVLDLNAAMRDAVDPQILDAQWEHTDHLHFNNLGVDREATLVAAEVKL